MSCTMTNDQHVATWKTWRDDCLGPDGCGFSMLDVDQCIKGHPDDGVTMCGACGYPGKGIHDPAPGTLTVDQFLAMCGIENLPADVRRAFHRGEYAKSVTPKMPVAPNLPPVRPHECGAGVTPCGAPARFYPCGWRCDAHAPRAGASA